MKLCSLTLVVALHSRKIIKYGLFFERGENLLQNGILHCILDESYCHKLNFKVGIYANEKPIFHLSLK